MEETYENKYEPGTFFYHARKEENNIKHLMSNYNYAFTSDTFSKNIDFVFEENGLVDTLSGAEVKVKNCSTSKYEDFIVTNDDLNKMVKHKRELGLKEVYYINMFEDGSLMWPLAYIQKNRANIRKTTGNYARTSCTDRNQEDKPKTMYHLPKEHAKVIDCKKL